MTRTTARQLALCAAVFGAFLILPELAAQTVSSSSAAAAPGLSVTPDQLSLNIGLEGSSFSKAINIALLMTALALAPTAVLLMTSFTRILIVIGFLKQALGTQQAPSARVVSGLALFLTVFIMQPVWNEVYQESIAPYSEGKITQKAALDNAVNPIRMFMLKQTRESSLLLFMDLAHIDAVDSPEDLPLSVVIPAFVVSELRTAFQMGFLIYLPFLIIDMVVATVLMSMGMMMLPPTMISLPFKILLFILVDGWTITVKALVESFL